MAKNEQNKARTCEEYVLNELALAKEQLGAKEEEIAQLKNKIDESASASIRIISLLQQVAAKFVIKTKNATDPDFKEGDDSWFYLYYDNDFLTVIRKDEIVQNKLFQLIDIGWELNKGE